MMKLWTWQNPILDITNPHIRIESMKYSQYNFPDKYKKLWSILGTDQFHWCFADKKEATNGFSRAQYADAGNILWEVDVPEDWILKKICNVTWHWILQNQDANPPKIFERDIFLWKNGRATFEKDFNKPWRDMKHKQLWDCLFYDCGNKQCCRVLSKHPVFKKVAISASISKQCYQVLVRHPVEASWVIKNPLKDINWWQNTNL